MLGKLVSHEWKDSWKIMTILNIAVFALSIIGAVFLRADEFAETIGVQEMRETMIALVYSSYFTVYVLSIITLSIVATLYFYIRFYRNLYTDQGYLMHTLPVTSKELIWSKAIVAIIWRFISSIVMFVGIAILVVAGFELRFMDELREMFRAFAEVFDQGPLLITLYIILTVLGGIGSVFFSVFKGYTAISFGQMAAKNKVLASVGAYFGIHIAINIFGNIFMQAGMLVLLGTRGSIVEMFEDPGLMMIVFLIALNIGVYGLSLIGYLISNSIMKNRLNLE